jgi:DNA-binding GntR family transcriptional regulator
VAGDVASSVSDGRKRSTYERVRDAILDGTFTPGSPLVEVTVAEMYGVSRTPIREAMTRLEQDGLVERGPRGLIVRERSPEEILDIYETRITLEATASRIAAERWTALDLGRLRRAMADCLEVKTSDTGRMAAVNRAFHSAVWQCGRNQSLVDLLNRLSMHLTRYPETTLAHPGRWEEACLEHSRMVDAIAARDGELASQLATQHFTKAREIRLQRWEQGLP